MTDLSTPELGHEPVTRKPQTYRVDGLPRVYWKNRPRRGEAQSEYEQIAAAAVPHLRETGSLIAAVVQGQRVLPPDRQRIINGKHCIPAELAKLIREKAAAPEPAPAPEPEPMPEALIKELWEPYPPQRAPEPQPERGPTPLEIETALAFQRDHKCAEVQDESLEQRLGRFVVDNLVTVAKRLLADPEIQGFASDFTRALVEHELRQRRENYVPGDSLRGRDFAAPPPPAGMKPGAQPLPAEPERERPPVVLVCGIKPFQRAMFQSELEPKLRLKFWYDDGLPTLRAKAQGADHVFMTLDATSHQARHTVEQMVGMAWNLIPGGQTGMLMAIKEWARTRKGVVFE